MKWLKFLIAALIVMAGVMVCNPSIDNDSWYVLAEGREIVENGVYHEDQLSMHEGLEVTVQNYGFAVIFYGIYSVFGPVGIYIGMLILNLVLCYLIYKICMLLSNKNVNLSFLIMILTDLLLARWFVVTRAQMVTYCILMLVIYLLELYIKTDKAKYLWWIPILSVLQINLHASVWLMMILVMGVYVIDSFKFKKLHLQGYRKKSLLIVLLLSFLVGFLNPYGLRMITFIFTSYGIPEANNLIGELTPYTVFGGSFEILLYIVFGLTLLFYIFGNKQSIRMRWLILLFGFFALGLNTSKGLSYVILVLLFPMAAIYKNVLVEKWRGRKIRWMFASWLGILALSLIVAITISRAPEIIDGPTKQLISAMDAIDADVGEKDKDNLKIYVNYDNGGFVEYRGYKAYIDPRMEVFLKSNNGKEDIFKEYYYLGRVEGMTKKEFLDKYNFDYVLVRDADDKILYTLDEADGYEKIFEDEGEDRNGIRIYKKSG